MTWYAVCEADGTLRSVTEVVADPLPSGLVAHVIPDRPVVPSTWDKQTLAFVPKPVPPPDVDRVGEFVTRLRATGSLTGALETRIRSQLVTILGDARFRDPAETYEVRTRA